MYCWGAELPLAPIDLFVTACRCGTVRLARVAFCVSMSLPREDLWLASWCFSSAIPASVR